MELEPDLEFTRFVNDLGVIESTGSKLVATIRHCLIGTPLTAVVLDSLNNIYSRLQRLIDNGDGNMIYNPQYILTEIVNELEVMQLRHFSLTPQPSYSSFIQQLNSINDELRIICTMLDE